MLWKNVELEKRNENEPKFNPKNKTDRKIVSTLFIVLGIAVTLLAGVIALYFIFFN